MTFHVSEDELRRRIECPVYLQRTPISLPASFVPLLMSNDPPPTTQIEEAIELRESSLEKISECKRQEDEILEEIRKLESKLTEAKSYSRRPLELQVHACDVILSPIRRLPSDIIHEIILRCPVYCSEKPYEHVPSTLAQVCSSWRTQVCGTRSLWTTFKFQWPSRVDAMEFFTRSARLSHTLPMTMKLEALSVKDGTQPLISFLKRLLEHEESFRSRLELLDILSPEPLSILRLLKDTEFPLLRSCQILPKIVDGNEVVDENSDSDSDGTNSDVFYDESQYSFKIIHDFTRNSQQLREIFLGGFYFSDLLQIPNQVHPSVSLTQLGTVHFSLLLTFTEWRFFLFLCPNLQNGWFVCYVDMDPELAAGVGPVIVQHSLKKLILLYEGVVNNIMAPLSTLRFPVLDSLEISRARTRYFSSVVERPPLPSGVDLTEIFPSLERLFINISTAHQEDQYIPGIHHLFEAIPTTKYLFISLCGTGHIPSLFSYLWKQRAEDGNIYLPNLQTLELEFRPNNEFQSWPKSESSADKLITQPLFSIRQARSESLTPLQQMIVRYNAIETSPLEESGDSDTKLDMTAYFWCLHHKISLLDDVDITVVLETIGERTRGISPMMSAFMRESDFLNESVLLRKPYAIIRD